MKNIISGVIRSKATLASLLVLAGVVGVSALANAWGPNRRTFTIEQPADYITFNSITNSPYGDERNFVRIKEVGQPDSTYTDEIKLVPGKEYEVYTFFHNNAAANLNLVAKDTKLKVFIPNEIKAGQKVRIDSEISASNANPAKVYDEAYVSTDSDVALRYVPGSAVLNSLHVKNVALPFDQMIKDGTLIGTYGRDGRVPGCNEFSGHVLYRFQVVQPNFTVQKEVRKVGAKDWTKELKDLKGGEIVEYRVVYTNTGTITQNNVHLKEALPKGLTYIDGSAEFRNSRTKAWVKLSAEADKQFKETGFVRLGDYLPNSNAGIRYRLKIEDADKMNCGYNQYTNIVSAVTQNGTKQDRVTVTAHKHCEVTKPKQIQVCELKTKQIITINESAFNSNLHSKNLDDCKTKPVQPTPPGELPKTGLDTLAGLIGLTSLVASVGYYVNSRKLA